MKRFLSLLLTVMLVLSLCIVVFADTDSYGDEPVQAVQTTVEDEQPKVKPHNEKCERCGKATTYAKYVTTTKAGPYEEDCPHSYHGTDEVYYYYVAYVDVCRSCGRISKPWIQRGEEAERICHGWYKTKH